VCVKVKVKTDIKMTATGPVNGLNSPCSVEDDSEVIVAITCVLYHVLPVLTLSKPRILFLF